MKKKIIASALAFTMLLGACNNSTGKENEQGNENPEESSIVNYADLKVGEDFTDLEAEISFYNHRTDMDSDDYQGKNWKQYIEEFNKVYPNIKVNVLTDTAYADNALTHISSGEYENVMMIPALDKKDYQNYFYSFGSLDEMDKLINYAIEHEYGKQVYGVPTSATTVGILYNKAVFEKAGVKELPKTPEDFISALQAIKEKTDAIPLYTNYAAGWTMGAWDQYIAINSTGDPEYFNQKFLHTKDPFKDYGDSTHPYAVYKVLYDAVANKLTEDDYTTTDWESSKTRMNNGEIATMVLGSWAIPQVSAAGENADDIGYMTFPISIDGKQYSYAGPDYPYAINKNASQDEIQASLIFVKWMTDESGYTYNEFGLPVSKKSEDTKLSFDNVELLSTAPAVEGEEDLFNNLNSESELNINAGGDQKIQQIIEHAAIGDKTFDEIMSEWNQRWSDAQAALDVEVNE